MVTPKQAASSYAKHCTPTPIPEKPNLRTVKDSPWARLWLEGGGGGPILLHTLRPASTTVYVRLQGPSTLSPPIVSIVVLFLVKATVYLGSYRVTPNRN